MPLTDEQQAVVHSRSEALKVVAFAGAGKTSTLRAYAQARPERRMLYLAFNSSIAREASGKFTLNVTCLTTHQLAYRAVGHAYRQKLVNTIRANQAAQALGLNPADRSDLGFGFRSLQALKHFISTSYADLEEFATFVARENRHQQAAVKGANQLWQAMCDIGNQTMPMLHDGYLKLFQLSEPQLDFDTILFDEAQDANPVTLAILRQQRCAKVFVGDPHQQIYQFRYAENAMADPLLTEELFLTESFRFGQEVATAANRLLAVKRERNQVRGGRRVPPTSSKACIARGNASLYKRAALVAQQGETVCWVGGINGYRLDLLQDIWQLKAGRRSEIKDRFVLNFHDYDALQGYADAQDERDLKAWIRVIESHSNMEAIPQEIALVRSCSVTQPHATTLTLSTAHKSKGLEFGSVVLADDFPEAELANPLMYNRESYPQFWDEEGFKGGILLPVEEINLRYVAITRAEASCTSGQWPAPMFSGLADYISRHPRFLTQEEAMTMQSRTDCNHVESTIPLTEPTVHLPLLNESLSAVVANFHKRYPLLRWDSLAQESQQGASSVEELINRHQLHSARPLIAEFVNALKSEDADIKDSAQQTKAQVITIVQPLTAEEEEQEFREWMKALNERRDSVGELNSDAELQSGRDEFYSTEEEMARQLGPEAQPFWLDQWEVPEEPPDPEEENMALEIEIWVERELAKLRKEQLQLPWQMQQEPDEVEELETEPVNYSDELDQESASYREWDDIDNFWNQEGVFEEMSDLSDSEQSTDVEYNGSLNVIDEMEEKLGFDENAGLQEFYAEEAEMERQLGTEA